MERILFLDATPKMEYLELNVGGTVKLGSSPELARAAKAAQALRSRLHWWSSSSPGPGLRPSMRSTAPSAMAKSISMRPLSTNRPRAAGDTIRLLTATPPADSPKIVT